jgi:PAS domain S-box-containing protein
MQKPLQALLDKLSRIISSASNALNNSDQKKNNTENKHLEEQLKILSCAVEQNPCTIVITDIKGNIEYVNPKFTQLTGYSTEEAIGQNPRILKTDKTSPEEYERLWKAIMSGKEWHGEFCNKKKNGELYWESASISPVRNSEGAITHFVAVKEDITQRKRMEEKLTLFNKYLEAHVIERTKKLKEKNTKLLNEIIRREQVEDVLQENVEKIQKITSSAFDTIIMMDDEGKVSFWNEAAERMFGYSREEVIGKNLHKMIVPDRYYDAFQKGMEGFIKDGTGLIINKKRWHV